MVQKYKVFINDYLLEITSPDDVSNTISTSDFLEKSGGDLDEVLHQMWEQPSTDVRIIADDPAACWNDMCQQYKWVEAAGGLVCNEKGQVLLIYRNDQWDLPKGKAEKGESIAETALREVEEECDVKGLELGAFLGHTYHTYPHKGKRVLKQTTWYRMKCLGNQDLRPQVEEGITQVIWAESAEAMHKLQTSFRSLSEFFIPRLR